MTDTLHDLLVIGGGQAGLATAHHASHKGWNVVVVESGPAPTGSWRKFYDSLTLFSPARHSSLPGLPFPGDPNRYPHRDEVVDYLAKYAAGLDAHILLNTPVNAVQSDGGGFAASTRNAVVYARRVVNATGGFATPYRPALPGLKSFPGTLLHSAEYVSPQRFASQHVVVVGAGNSAVQIATELAAVARVTLTSRHPVKFIPQRPFGRDIHDWLAWSRLGHGRPSVLLKRGGVAALDDGRHQRALEAGNPMWRLMFTHVDGDRIHWTDGTTDTADAVILATGFRPQLSHLDSLRSPFGQPAVTKAAGLAHRGGVSTVVPGLAFVGLEWQRGFASATLRGVGPDAAHVLERLARQVTGSRPSPRHWQ